MAAEPEVGPVDYLVIEFPGSRLTGEGLPLLVDLVDRGIIRILDLVFIKKQLDGTITGLALDDDIGTAYGPCFSAGEQSRGDGVQRIASGTLVFDLPVPAQARELRLTWGGATSTCDPGAPWLGS